MKIQGWNMKSLEPKEWRPEDGNQSKDIQSTSFVAVKDNKRVVLHRVVKTNPDGTEERPEGNGFRRLGGGGGQRESRLEATDIRRAGWHLPGGSDPGLQHLFHLHPGLSDLSFASLRADFSALF